MKDTLFICHRINNIEELKYVKKKEGIEIDLRDRLDNIILSHDPFDNGEFFDNFLKNYDKQLIILNIKSERIEFKILDILKKYNIQNYFFLDCSFPMIYQLNKLNENNIAIRFSEFESLNTIELVKNMVKWVWVDCFNTFPLDRNSYSKIKNLGLKICLVSPELQGHDIKKIKEIKELIYKNNFHIDAICTKYYNIKLWK